MPGKPVDVVLRERVEVDGVRLDSMVSQIA